MVRPFSDESAKDNLNDEQPNPKALPDPVLEPVRELADRGPTKGK
jgi:hypothetical protein